MDAPGAPLSGARGRWDFRRAFAGLTIRTVLAVGFVLTAGTWIFAGTSFSRRIHALEVQAAETGRRYVLAQQLLSDTRNDVYRASFYVRDAFLDDNPTAGQYKARVDAAYREADGLLAQYVPVVDSGNERDRIERLRAEINALRVTNLKILESARDHDASVSHTHVMVGDRVLPRRDAAVRIADEIQMLNRAAYVQQRQQTADLYRATQRRFWDTLAFGVIASVCIAMLAGFHVNRLDGSLRTQLEKDAAAAVDLQRLSAQLVSTQEEERRNIARELHHDIGQVLTVVKIELANAQRDIAQGGSGSELLDEARSTTDRALTAVRGISHSLHPPLLDSVGLSAALDWYTEAMSKRHGLRIEFTRDGPRQRLSSECEVALYRIAQEGVTNCVRHARASACDVVVTGLESSVRITVSDNGIGFRADGPEGVRRGHTGGLGLIGVRQRAMYLGGSFDLRTAPGAGTTFTVELPVPFSSDDATAESPELSPTEAA